MSKYYQNSVFKIFGCGREVVIALLLGLSATTYIYGQQAGLDKVDFIQKVQVVTLPIYHRQVNAEVLIRGDLQTNRASIEFTSGIISLKPSGPQRAELNWVAVAWCTVGPNNTVRVNPTLAPNPSYTPLLSNLQEYVDASKSFRLDGKSIQIDLPLDDPELLRSWLCIETGAIENGERKYTYASSTDAVKKGCTTCP